jgi:hypothetical protein
VTSVDPRAPGGVARVPCVLVLDVFGVVLVVGQSRGVLLGELGGVLECLGEPVEQRRELVLGCGDAARVGGGVVGGLGDVQWLPGSSASPRRRSLI